VRGGISIKRIALQRHQRRKSGGATGGSEKT